ncbi:hypothetical protein AKO1_012223 [Acrasis kona]|uniref:ATP synthase F0 subunit 8 n=1 Tax=Acrasis kona TaxID=1008807 RepID=A0AAW2ZAN4_9EUKA
MINHLPKLSQLSGDGRIAMLIWKFIIYVIQSITLIAYAHTVYLFYSIYQGYPIIFSGLISQSIYAMTAIWMVAEVVWLPWYYFKLQKLQVRGPVTHYSQNTTSREDLLQQSLEALKVATGDLKKVVEGWFFGAPIETIHRGNLKQLGCLGIL